MKIHLDNLVFQEKLHGLPADLMRHHAYEVDLSVVPSGILVLNSFILTG